MGRAHKGKPLQVLLTEDQRALIDRAANRVGSATSTWIRGLALKEALRIEESARHPARVVAHRGDDVGEG